MAYAESTEVSAEKSRSEIERTLTRYGASGFFYGWDEDRAVLAFKMKDRHIKFVLPLPKRDEKRFTHWKRAGYDVPRVETAALAAWEQACRQRWRALALVIKAKLEAVEAGISILEDEFMAHIVLPDGKTVGEFMRPQIALAYDKGNMPPLLPYYGDP